MSLPTEIKQKPGKPGYWTSYYCNSKKQTKWVKLANTMPLARRALKKLQQELTLGVNEKTFEAITLAEYYNRHYKPDFLSEEGTRSWSGKQRMHIEKYILPTFGNNLLHDIKLYDVEVWYRKLMSEKHRKYAWHIGSSFKRLVKRAEGKFIEHSLISGLKLVKPERRIPDTLTREEVITLLKNTRSRDYALVVLWIHTGLRVGEMQYLQVRDINLKQGKLFVRNKPEHKIKTFEDRYIDLTHECIEVIRPYVEDHKLGQYVFGTVQGSVVSNFNQVAKRICIRAGVPKGNGLLLRHYFASVFISSGGNLRELQRIMGHASIVTTEQSYAAWLPGHRATIHNIDFGLGCLKDVSPACPGVIKMEPKTL